MARALGRLRPSSLRDLRGKVDWSSDPEALRRGEWDGRLSPDIIARLQEAAKRPEVQQLAATLGLTPELVALALLALEEAASSRAAARFFRKVLGTADPVDLEKQRERQDL